MAGIGSGAPSARPNSHWDRQASGGTFGRPANEGQSAEQVAALGQVDVPPTERDRTGGGTITNEEGRSTNRGRHLRTILRVFRRRGVGWGAFSAFLQWLFYEGGMLQLSPQRDCLHWTLRFDDPHHLRAARRFRGDHLLEHGKVPYRPAGYSGPGHASHRRPQMCLVRAVFQEARRYLAPARAA